MGPFGNRKLQKDCHLLNWASSPRDVFLLSVDEEQTRKMMMRVDFYHMVCGCLKNFLACMAAAIEHANISLPTIE